MAHFNQKMAKNMSHATHLVYGQNQLIHGGHVVINMTSKMTIM